MKEIIINHFLDYEFVYIFLFCSLFFLFLTTFIKQVVIRKLLVLFFSIFIILFLFELVLSFFMDKIKSGWYFDCCDKINCNITKTKEIVFLNDKNVKIKSINADVGFVDPKKIIYNVCYSRFSNKFRCTKCNENAAQTYIFLGCSFTFGDGLNDNETLPYFFSKKFNFERNIINCGVEGHSSNTSLNILNNEIFLPLINNKRTKIEHCFYSLMEDHIYRNFRIEDPSDIKIYMNKQWSFNRSSYFLLRFIFARSYIFRKIFLPIIEEHNRKNYEDYMIESLKEINKIVEERYSSKLTIIVWNVNLYNKYFMEKLKKTNLDLIFLPDKFNLQNEGYRIKNDDHPTAKANEELAQILYNHINGLE